MVCFYNGKQELPALILLGKEGFKAIKLVDT